MTARWVVVAALGLAGCKDKVEAPASCKAFTATIAKIGECKVLPESSRALIRRQVDMINRAIGQLESADAGDQAKRMIKTLDEMCVRQNENIKTMYAKIAPDCL